MKPLNLIFLIDDDDTTNFINNRTLVKTGIAREIRIFTDAEKALDYLQNAIKENDLLPELILMDIKMPKMDGFDFLEEYHKLNLKDLIPTKIMMLTSSASFYDLKRLEQYVEVEKHFAKPLSVHDIRELVAEFFPENLIKN